MEIKDIIVNAKETIYSESMVKQLVAEDVSEYDRGVLAGRIQMLVHIEHELNRNEDEDSSL